MSDGGELKIPLNSSPEADALIAGKSVEFYWRTVRWLAVLLVVAEAVLIALGRYSPWHWLVEAGVFVLLTWWLVQRHRIKLAVALSAAFFLALLSGLALAVFDIIWYHKWWYIMNGIRRPVMMAAVGWVTSFIFYIIFRSIKIRRHGDQSKGGDIYGRTETKTSQF